LVSLVLLKGVNHIENVHRAALRVGKCLFDEHKATGGDVGGGNDAPPFAGDVDNLQHTYYKLNYFVFF
jgi:hypothetical protein